MGLSEEPGIESRRAPVGLVVQVMQSALAGTYLRNALRKDTMTPPATESCQRASRSQLLIRFPSGNIQPGFGGVLMGGPILQRTT